MRLLLLLAVACHGPGDGGAADTHDADDTDDAPWDDTWCCDETTTWDTGTTWEPRPPPEPLDGCLAAGGTLAWDWHSAWRPAVDPTRVVLGYDALVATGSDLLIVYDVSVAGYGGFDPAWNEALATSDGLAIAVGDDADELYSLDDAGRLVAWDLHTGGLRAELDTAALPGLRTLAAGYRRVEAGGGATLGWWSTLDGTWTARGGPVTDVARIRRVDDAVYVGGAAEGEPIVAVYDEDATEAPRAKWIGGGAFADVLAASSGVVVATIDGADTTLTLLDPAELSVQAAVTVAGLHLTRLDGAPTSEVFVALDGDELAAFAWADLALLAREPNVRVSEYGPALDVTMDPTGRALVTVNDEGGYAWWTCHPPEAATAATSRAAAWRAAPRAPRARSTAE